MIRFFGTACLRGHSRTGFVYRIAGHDLWADVPLSLLSEYARGPTRTAPRPEPMPSADPDALVAPDAPLAQDAPDFPDAPARAVSGWLAGQTRRVVCRAGPAGYELEIAALASFLVSPGGERIHCTGVAPRVAPALVEEALLGPPITLALALRGVWCLHASAVLRQGRAILFLGASGQGKSTLAAHCRAAPDAGYRRIGDDILPCTLVAGRPRARPHFPQLKLALADRYPLAADENIPLDGLIVLAPTQELRAVVLEPMPLAAALKALAEQTVAVTLFDRSLRQAHLRFMAALVGQVSVQRLHYPHDYARLPQVFDRLTKGSIPFLDKQISELPPIRPLSAENDGR